jgi:fatty-acyl-CoA synthase
MINASGYKVWPAEVEALMHAHPEIKDVCVVGVPDAKRGETVKAIVVPRNGAEPPSEREVIAWCREHMAAYKAPTAVAFSSDLPRSAAGKLLWRQLQERERDAVTG